MQRIIKLLSSLRVSATQPFTHLLQLQINQMRNCEREEMGACVIKPKLDTYALYCKILRDTTVACLSRLGPDTLYIVP